MVAWGGYGGAMPLELPPTALGTLLEGRQAHLAVASQNGPHVTPDLYAWSGGKLWMAVASTTLKAKVLRRDPSAGALVTASGRSVLLEGDIEVVDPREALRFVQLAPRTPELVRAVAAYTVRNAPDLLAFLGDTAAGRLGRRLPPLRLLVAMTPRAGAAIEDGDVVGSWGSWPGSITGAVAPVPAGGTPAVVGLPGPVAAPAHWFAQRKVLHVAPGLLDLLAPEEQFDVGIVTDEYGAPGPAAKSGTLLRGRASSTGEPGQLAIELDRSVTWDGVETSSAPLPR